MKSAQTYGTMAYLKQCVEEMCHCGIMQPQSRLLYFLKMRQKNVEIFRESVNNSLGIIFCLDCHNVKREQNSQPPTWAIPNMYNCDNQSIGHLRSEHYIVNKPIFKLAMSLCQYINTWKQNVLISLRSRLGYLEKSFK